MKNKTATRQHWWKLEKGILLPYIKGQIFKFVVKINLVISHWNSVISGRISLRSQRTTHL
ncbi:MAG TPA: hypothetical protein DD791_12435 [Syntrophomonas sp.]|nr:hypothetical protein [Syntrophomonas sp.]